MPDPLPTLLATHGNQLHTLLLRLTLRSDLAEELMQDLIVKLSTAPTFRDAQNPAAYAFRAAINLALEARRRRAKKFAQLPPDLASSLIPPAEILSRSEQADRVVAAITELPPKAREAAILHFLQQHSYEEMAAMMGRTPQQARPLCADALRQLRAKFNLEIAREITHD